MDISVAEDVGMIEASETDEEMYECLLEKIVAFSRGFLLVVDQSLEKACSFCKGLLILLDQLKDIKPKETRA